jgi:dipeptidyl aminopeptidase/acylaminoacyl peptidase
MGGSYGGYLTAWLVTQTDAFAAAGAMHPITDWVMQHGASNIGSWDELFLDGKPYAADGLYRQRSPMTHVQAVNTPTLLIAGRLDRATPPDQARVMHQALVDLGVPSQCVVHPHEAHGARDLSAAIDNIARTIDWFQSFMPADTQGGGA